MTTIRSLSFVVQVILLGILAETPSPGQTCEQPPFGAVAWWRGEGTALDSVANHHGTLIQGAGFGTGRFGSGFVFDGMDDLMEVPSDPALNFGTGDFTVSCWAKLATLRNEQILMEKFVNATGQGWTFTLQDAGDGWRLHFFMDSAGAAAYSSFIRILSGEWHHCLARRQGGKIELFFDGQPVGVAEATGNADSPASFKLGRRGDDERFYLNGSLDEVVLYRRALSDAEILSMYQACPLKLGITQSTNTPGQVEVNITGGPGKQYLIHRTHTLSSDGMSEGVPVDQLPPQLMRVTDGSGAAPPAAVESGGAAGFFVGTDYDGPIQRLIFLRRGLPQSLQQGFDLIWVFTNDAPGRQQSVRLRAPGDLSLARNDLRGLAPATGSEYYLDASGLWSTNKTFIPGFGGLVVGPLPELRTGRWRVEWALTDPPANEVAELASFPFLVTDASSMYLHLSRSSASPEDPMSAWVELAAGSRLVAWLVQPDGTQVGLPGFEPGLSTVFDGPPSDLRLPLFDRTFDRLGTYRLEARLLDGDNRVLGLARREFQICDSAPALLSGVIWGANGQRLGKGVGLASVTAFNLEDRATAAVGGIANDGTFRLLLRPGDYSVHARVLDEAGLHETPHPELVRVLCGETARSLTLTSAPPYGPGVHLPPAISPAAKGAGLRLATASDGLPAPRVFLTSRIVGLSEVDARYVNSVFTDRLRLLVGSDVSITTTKELRAELSDAAADLAEEMESNSQTSLVDLGALSSATGAEFLMRLEAINSSLPFLSVSLFQSQSGTIVRGFFARIVVPDANEWIGRAYEAAGYMASARDDTNAPLLFTRIRASQDRPIQPHLTLEVTPEVAEPDRAIVATATLRERDAAGALQTGQPVQFKATRGGGVIDSGIVRTGADGKASFHFLSGGAPPPGSVGPGRVEVTYLRNDQRLASASRSFSVQSDAALTLSTSRAQVEAGGQMAVALDLDLSRLPRPPIGISPVSVISSSGVLTSPTGVTTGTGLYVTPDAGGHADLYATVGNDAGMVQVTASLILTNVVGGVTNLQPVSASILFAVDTGLTLLSYASPSNTLAGFLSRVVVDSQVDGARLPGLRTRYFLDGLGMLSNAAPFTDGAGRSEVTFLAPTNDFGTSYISAVLTFDLREYTNTSRVTWEPLPSLCGPSNAIRGAITGWWPGDSNPDDVVGGRHALLRGGAAYEAGLVTNAFRLNGQGQFVEVPHDPALDVGTGDFTLEAWVRFNTLEGEQVIAEKYVETFGVNRSGWTLTKIGSSLRWALREFANLDSGLASTAHSATNWTHLAIRRLGTLFSVFQNGALTVSSNVVCNLDSPSSLKFGHRGNPTDTPGSKDERQFWLDGAIDEPTIYVGRALTDLEIRAIYENRAKGKCR